MAPSTNDNTIACVMLDARKVTGALADWQKTKSAEILVIGISYLAILTVDGLRAATLKHTLSLLLLVILLCANHPRCGSAVISYRCTCPSTKRLSTMAIASIRTVGFLIMVFWMMVRTRGFVVKPSFLFYSSSDAFSRTTRNSVFCAAYMATGALSRYINKITLIYSE